MSTTHPWPLIATSFSESLLTPKLMELDVFTAVVRPPKSASAYEMLLRSYEMPLLVYKVGDNFDLPAHPATNATEALSNWLGLGLDATVALVGLAPSARQFWRDRPSAPIKPEKAGRLIRLHTAVGLLVGHIGSAQARSRLQAQGWLDGQLDDAGLRALEAWVGDIVAPTDFIPPPFLSAGKSKRQLRKMVTSPKAELAMQAAERQKRVVRGEAGPSHGDHDRA